MPAATKESHKRKDNMEDENLQGQTQAAEMSADASGQSVEQTQAEEGLQEQAKEAPVPYSKFKEEREKLQGTISSLKDEIARLSTNTGTEAANQGNEGALGSYETPEEALKAIANAVKSELSPLLSPLQEQVREKAIQEVGSRPFGAELAQEIAAEYVKLKGSMRDDQALDAAYKEALAKNIARLYSQGNAKSEETGYNAAYAKIAEKQAATPAPSGASQERGSGELSDEEIGSMSQADWNKNREAILRSMGIRPN